MSEKPVEIIGAEAIQTRVRELAAAVQRDTPEGELTVCAVMTGSLFLAADLVRYLTVPTRLVTVEATSYRGGTTPGRLVVRGIVPEKVRGHDVLLLDDIYDSGRTMEALVKRLRRRGATRVRTCVLLRKLREDVPDCPADFVGFEVPNEFVVGYGMDYDGRYRNLPSIARIE